MDRREYRLMTLVGTTVICGGIVAATVDSIAAAAVAIVVGTMILIAGLVGAWLSKE